MARAGSPPGWEVVSVRAASLNHHDLWTLRGVVGVPFEPPVVLGCDGAGVTTDGREVVIYPCLGFGPSFRMLTDGVDGTFAPRVAVPSANLVDKPASLSFEEAACLPTAWLTAWRMLFVKARVVPGEHVLVQGASGGVPTAAIALAVAAGAHVTVTSRSEAALDHARAIGAHETLPTGAELAEKAHVVLETVGAATWEHTHRSLRFGGRIVVAGATSGAATDAQLRRIFWNEAQIFGSKMGTLEEFEDLCRFVDHAGLRPAISRVYDGIASVPDALRDLAACHQVGKLVVRIG